MSYSSADELRQILEDIIKLAPSDRIRGYQTLRASGSLDISIAERLIYRIVEQIAMERVVAALERYPDAIEAVENLHNMHTVQVLREHGEEQLADILEDPEQRRQFFAPWDGGRPPDPN